MDLGLTNNDVAERIGVSEASSSKWQWGEYPPGTVSLPAVIAFLGYNPLPVGETLGERIQWARHSLGLKQAEVAERLGVTQTTVGAYENNRSTPVSEHIKKAIEQLIVEAGRDRQ